MIKEVDRFLEDDERTAPYRLPMKSLYRHLTQDGEFICLCTSGGSLLTRMLQSRQVDAIFISPLTRRETYSEEKYDFHQPKNFCLETVSNTTTDPPKPGWMTVAQSDCLAYSFIWLKNVLDTFIIDFNRLRPWFWEEEPKRLKSDWGEWEVPDSPNHTRSRLVPVGDVIRNVSTRRYLITSDGIVYPVPTQVNVKEFLELHNVPFEVIA